MDNVSKARPQWWTSNHASAWERGKAALRRDWEQTKRDFGGSGADINQDAGDTFRQLAGKAPVPPTTVPNVPDAGDVKRHAKEAAEAAKDAFDAGAKAAQVPRASEEGRKLEEKAAEARLAAKNAALELHQNVNLRWENVEEAVEYGYGAAMHHAPEWNEAKADLRTDWLAMHPDRPWAEIEEHVLQGWNSARAQSTFRG